MIRNYDKNNEIFISQLQRIEFRQLFKALNIYVHERKKELRSIIAWHCNFIYKNYKY
jgi:hypothetical protein